ncbi:MAG: arylsulfatase [Bacteroidia bacterium]
MIKSYLLRFFSVATPYFFCLGLLSLLSACQEEATERSANERPPNIVLIYVDDLGYGDLGCYGAIGVETPNVDRLAAGGLKFTDGHCSAATCTPSRYALLTGEYAFRNNAAILPGDAPLIIDPRQPTLPRMLQKSGYATAVVGKWHLGLGDGQVDWNEAVSPGPLEIGFDYSFLIPATGDRVPTVYLEDHHVLGLDPDDSIIVSYGSPIEGVITGLSHPEQLRVKADNQHSATIVNGVSRIGYMSGGEAARWTDEDFPRILDEKAKTFMRANQQQPFFLYYSFHDIHVPRLPHVDFQGKSKMGPRGDAIVQMDWMVGQIMQELEDIGLAEETMIIFTSDNGPVLNDGYEDLAEEKIGQHRPAGPFRGGKYSAFEAGTRVPTIVYWPGTVKAGTSNALVSQVDLMASLAELIGNPQVAHDHLDSQPMLRTWLGQQDQGRAFMIEESYTLSLRQGDWKYIRPIMRDRPNWLAAKNIEGGFEKIPQLYDLRQDPGEQENLAERIPERVQAMEQQLQAIEQKASPQ